MPEPEKHTQGTLGVSIRAERAAEHVLEAGKASRHVQWGPNESSHIQSNVRELDELGQDSGAFASLRRSLVSIRESRGRGPNTDPAQDLGLFIDPDETEGLPALTDRGQGAPKETPVKPALSSWRIKRKLNKKVKDKENAVVNQTPKPSNSDPFDLRSMEGTGILSALLATYDRNQFGSVETSAYGSDVDIPTQLRAAANEKPVRQRRPRLARLGSSLDDIFNKISGSEIPEEAQTGAGVMGALIAATGNLTSIASPSHSAIAPDVTKPGYHISRYSIPERPLKLRRSRSSSRAPSIVIDSGPVTPKGESKSQEASLPTSPASGNQKARGWAAAMKTLTPGGSRHNSRPPSANTTDTEEESAHRMRHRRKKVKRKRDDIYITMHVAHIIHRQDFILKLARAFVMFGAPSHRLERRLQATGHILGLNVSCMYLPGIVLISFNDPATGTSNLKFIKQSSSLDLGKLVEAHALYWSVIHDEISVSDASSDLDHLMLRDQLYTGWITTIIGGLCSAFICPIAFQGSFLDSLVAFPLGALLVFVQNVSAKNQLYSSVFEIVTATLISFLAGALSSTGRICYSAVACAAIVLILPGYIILCGALEVASRNITSGGVRMCYSVIYSLFLGFGIAMGAEVWRQISGSTQLGIADTQCTTAHHPDGPWWQQTPSHYWAFLCTPMFALLLTLRNQAPFWKKELYIACLFACAGYTANFFASERFVNRKDINSAIGAFVVGVAGNIYGRFNQGNAFVVMISGIMFQLPTGLSNGGLLAFARDSTQGTADDYAYASGFQVAGQIVSVAVGLTVGLFIAAVSVYPFASKQRGTALLSL